MAISVGPRGFAASSGKPRIFDIPLSGSATLFNPQQASNFNLYLKHS
jgi:hypothetical protein